MQKKKETHALHTWKRGGRSVSVAPRRKFQFRSHDESSFDAGKPTYNTTRRGRVSRYGPTGGKRYEPPMPPLRSLPLLYSQLFFFYIWTTPDRRNVDTCMQSLCTERLVWVRWKRSWLTAVDECWASFPIFFSFFLFQPQNPWMSRGCTIYRLKCKSTDTCRALCVFGMMMIINRHNRNSEISHLLILFQDAREN